MTAGADAPRAGIGESNSRSSPVPPMQLDRASIVPGVADGDAEALLYSQTLAVGYKAMAWSHGRMVRLGTTLLPARGGSPVFGRDQRTTGIPSPCARGVAGCPGRPRLTAFPRTRGSRSCPTQGACRGLLIGPDRMPPSPPRIVVPAARRYPSFPAAT
jgi:hypothetical protein